MSYVVYMPKNWEYYGAMGDFLKAVAKANNITVKGLIRFIVFEALNDSEFVKRLEAKNVKINRKLLLQNINYLFDDIRQTKFVCHVKADAEFWVRQIDRALKGQISDDSPKKVYFLKFLDKDTLLFLKEKEMKLLESANKWLSELKNGEMENFES